MRVARETTLGLAACSPCRGLYLRRREDVKDGAVGHADEATNVRGQLELFVSASHCLERTPARFACVDLDNPSTLDGSAVS